MANPIHYNYKLVPLDARVDSCTIEVHVSSAGRIFMALQKQYNHSPSTMEDFIKNYPEIKDKPELAVQLNDGDVIQFTTPTGSAQVKVVSYSAEEMQVFGQ